MLHEFALDPQLLNNWNVFRYFADLCGVHTGRMISEFPKGWKQLVFKACELLPDMQKHRIIEGLAQFNAKLVLSRRRYKFDDQMPWLANAENAHAESAFHAIVSVANPNKHASVLAEGDLWESAPGAATSLWNVKRQKPVLRTAPAFAEATGGLLALSKHILFVDPHFSPENGRKWTEPLKAMLEAGRVTGRPISRCEYHTKLGDKNKDFVRLEWSEKLARILPQGFPLKIVLWCECGSEWLHDRYVMTEIGGIQFSGGLDSAGEQSQETQNAILLENELWSRRWSEYQHDSSAYRTVYQFVVRGTRG